MSYEAVMKVLEEKGFANRMTVHTVPCDTVPHAAECIGCSEAEIAKTMSFFTADGPVVIVCAGDVKVANSKFKAFFCEKARMVPWELVAETIGHEPGGVCPFALAEGVRVYLDESLRRFGTVHAAGGEPAATVMVHPEEFEVLCEGAVWADLTSPVCQNV